MSTCELKKPLGGLIKGFGSILLALSYCFQTKISGQRWGQIGES